MDADRVYPLNIVMAYGNCLKVTDDAFEQKSGHLHLQKNSLKSKRHSGLKDFEVNANRNEDISLLQAAAEASDLVRFHKNSSIFNDDKNSAASSIAIDLSEKETAESAIGLLFEKNLKVLQHCKRVGDLCEAIARAMDMGIEETNQIKISGLLHDIGKIKIREEILDKPGKLDADEWRQIQQHSEIGYTILSSITGLSKIAGYILQHHERWDGTGYPRGIHSYEISLQARIIAVADAYDAMTSVRSYRETVSREKAMAELRANAGSQFDPDIVAIFLEKVLKTGYSKASEGSLVYAVR